MTHAHVKRWGRRGMALGYAILMVLLVLVMGTALVGLSTTAGRLSNRRSLSLTALSAAQMGLDDARAEFAFNQNFLATGASKTYSFSRTEASTGAVLQCQYTITRTDKSATDADGNAVTVEQITSAGTVTQGDRTPISRKLQINLAPRSDMGNALNATIAANHTLTISGKIVNSIVNYSKIPHKGKTPSSNDMTNQGIVFSNQDVVLSGSTSIGGSVSAVGTVYGSSGRVTGSVKSGATPLYFPPITQAAKDAALVDGTTTSTGDITLSKGTIKGKYAIPATSTLIITGALTIPDNHTVWITGNLDLDGGPAYINGTGNVIVDGTITIDRTSASQMAGNILYMTTSSSSSAVMYNGVHIFRGVIYAPNGTINVTGGPNMSTNLIGDYVNVDAGGGLYNDISSPIPANNLPLQIQNWGWQELP